MTERPNPYRSPHQSGSVETTPPLKPLMETGPATIPLCFVGAIAGAVSLAQLFCCVGYYVNFLIHDMIHQKGMEGALAASLIGGPIGAVAGPVAVVQMLRGRWPDLRFVALVCVINTVALMGTVEFTLEISYRSITLRTFLVATICGTIGGIILSVLLKPAPRRLKPASPIV